MQPPTIYRVTPEQVGQRDVSDFLRFAISKQFEGQAYYIVNEQTLDKNTPYSPTKPRKIKAFAVEVEGVTHSLFFDVTDVSIFTGTTWFGR